MGIRLSSIGRVLNHSIERFVELTSEVWKGFNQNARLYNSSGEDSVPCKGDQIILVKIDGTGKYVAVGALTESKGAKPGEKIFFARDADAKIVSKISMLNDGSIQSESDGAIRLATKGVFDLSAEKEITFAAQENINIGADKDATMSAAANANIEAAEKAALKGADVEMNGKVKTSGGSFTRSGRAIGTSSDGTIGTSSGRAIGTSSGRATGPVVDGLLGQ